MTAPSTPTVSVVVLAYLDEPWVERCVASLLASRGARVDVVLVDNGCTTGAVERLTGTDGVTVVRPPENLGFAGGCNAGAERATGDFLGLVNADAVVEPDALARLAAVAARPDVGIASGSIRLADRPHLLNSCGNPLQILGLSWAGGFEEPAAEHSREQDVAGASGAGVVLRREVWDQLGGFPVEYFAYHEDTDLSWRCWQRGLRVVYVPDAVVLHRYEFSRNPLKLYLIERNRALFLLTTYERRTLLLLAPPLLALEVAMLLLALKQGWGRHKLRGWWWLATHLSWVRRRRALVQRERTVPDRALAHLLVPELTTTAVDLPAGASALNAGLRLWWAAARRAL
jgi:GT2 family glycosyltransferase